MRNLNIVPRNFPEELHHREFAKLLSSNDCKRITIYFLDWIDDILMRVIENQREVYFDTIEYKKTHPECNDEVHWDEAWLENGIPPDTIKIWFDDTSHEDIKYRVADDDIYDMCQIFLDAFFQKYYQGRTIKIDELKN